MTSLVSPVTLVASRRRESAFSLVEVTLSLGILAFVCVAIFGLISGSYSIARDSINDQAITQIVRNVVEERRGSPFDNLAGEALYFSTQGGPASNAADAAYKCDLAVADDPSTRSADGTVNLKMLTLTITWPVGVAATSNTRTFHVNVARY